MCNRLAGHRIRRRMDGGSVMNDSPLSPEAVAQTANILRGYSTAPMWGFLRKAADMLTTLAAENATLRASEAAALERITELEALLAASTHSLPLPG